MRLTYNFDKSHPGLGAHKYVSGRAECLAISIEMIGRVRPLVSNVRNSGVEVGIGRKRWKGFVWLMVASDWSNCCVPLGYCFSSTVFSAGSMVSFLYLETQHATASMVVGWGKG